VSQAYHCYALNYINALNYLETLRRHVEFCEFEKVRVSTRILKRLLRQGLDETGYR
jgi:ADP-dependent phosphofructokinase/glucokinase